MSYPKIEELKLNVDCKEDHDKKNIQQQLKLKSMHFSFSKFLRLLVIIYRRWFVSGNYVGNTCRR